MTFGCRPGGVRREGDAVSQVLIPGSVLAISGQAADRLLKLDSGDAALLYLYLLRRGSLEGLKWPRERLEAALAQLKSQGLAPEETPLPDPPIQEEPPPEYALEDISAALEDLSSAFPALCDEVERRLGKKLSANDLKILYTHASRSRHRCRPSVPAAAESLPRPTGCSPLCVRAIESS